jgi:hypothetical protein
MKRWLAGFLVVLACSVMACAGGLEIVGDSSYAPHLSASVGIGTTVSGPGVITRESGVRFGDEYDYRAVVNGDTVYVRDLFQEVRIGDTLMVEWIPQGDADLAGYHLIFAGSQARLEDWYTMEMVEIDTAVHAAKKLYIAPGIYYVGVDAADVNGNRSAMSVAVVLGVKPAGLLPPKRVRIILGI